MKNNPVLTEILSDLSGLIVLGIIETVALFVMAFLMGVPAELVGA